MKRQNTLVSILIINYNNGRLLPRAINSCLNQKYSKTEILVFDDNSKDNSKKVLNKFKNNKKIKIFFNKRKKIDIPALDAMNGYLNLFKKSKGSIVCLLDSDDYFHKLKVDEVNKFFLKNDKINFIQNLPKIKNTKTKKNNSFLSFWPYLAPESCICFRRKFMNNFLDKDKNNKYKFEDIWLGFRLGVYSYFCLKNFFTIEKPLTYYESLGESKKYKLFSKNWFKRRKRSFEYLKFISNNKIKLNKNIDFILTNFFIKFFKN
jgi:glycosyltransferase involved in cell wall biosynthesis